MQKKSGRPKNYETSEIKEIIDEYVMYTQGTVIINSSRVAEYAQNKKGMVGFKYYHINRNEEAREYMNLLNSRIKENPAALRSKAITTYEPIDISKYMNKTKEQLKKSLVNLNTFIEQLTNNNTELVKQKDEYKRLLDKKAIEIVQLQEQIRGLEKTKKELIEMYETREGHLKQKVKNLEKTNIDMSELMKILWEDEAEAILRNNHIFENNGQGIDPNKTITSLDDNFEKVKRESKKLEDKYKNKLKGLF